MRLHLPERMIGRMELEKPAIECDPAVRPCDRVGCPECGHYADDTRPATAWEMRRMIWRDRMLWGHLEVRYVVMVTRSRSLIEGVFV